MRLLRLLLPILFAVTFVAGGVARAMPMPAAEPPPCHKQMDAPAPHEAPTHKPAPPLAMSCCIACLAAPAAMAPLPVILIATARPTPAALLSPEGRRPAPEPGPPRAA